MPAHPGYEGAGRDDPDEGGGEPADRTRPAWTRTAIAFAAIGGVMFRSSLAAGRSWSPNVPARAAVRGTGPRAAVRPGWSAAGWLPSRW